MCVYAWIKQHNLLLIYLDKFSALESVLDALSPFTSFVSLFLVVNKSIYKVSFFPSNLTNEHQKKVKDITACIIDVSIIPT